ncbi:MAG: serine/threonine protein kinase [Candidatus Zixiibacteriota bacterium]|nr:MAG: serine/threonine protein kinase [candidate division Zixibacteria bacterium]
MVQAVQQKKELRIGDYILTGKIGQGGIAEIYKARQESLGRDVAIKILFSQFSDDPEILRRFELESVVIAKLNHPNIVHVIDKGKAGSRYYFVMEYVDGTSLREVIDSSKITVKTKLEMVVQTCKALDYAHKNGVIHRDIKPANILVDRQGNPRVADFGIAQIVTTPDHEVTSSDVVMGTLAYMSPEQRISSTNVDQTTDIYALGVIIYEILVGKKPMGRFKLPSEIDASIGYEYDSIIQKCLAQDPKDRFQSATELKNEILNSIGGGSSSTNAADYSVGGVESFVGNCQYLDTIKETRFGSTILVENGVSKRLYVIKKHSKGEAGRKEAKLLSTLKHKNIINILGSGGDKKKTVVISEYAAGGSLADRMARKHEWPKAMAVVLEIADGLDFAHKNNVIHGNIRPSNILFDANDVVKIIDFGLPVHYDVPNKKNWYSAPERKQSRQGDVYAVGVILHQLITGRNPSYDLGDNLRFGDISSSLPEDIQNILSKLLAVRVSKRYKGLGEMMLDWEDFERRREEARFHRNIKTETPVEKKKSLPVWAFVAAGAGLLAVIAAVLYFSGVFS